MKKWILVCMASLTALGLWLALDRLPKPSNAAAPLVSIEDYDSLDLDRYELVTQVGNTGKLRRQTKAPVLYFVTASNAKNNGGAKAL